MTQVLYGFDLYDLYANWYRADQEARIMRECAEEALRLLSRLSATMSLGPGIVLNQVRSTNYWAVECLPQPRTRHFVLMGVVFGTIEVSAKDQSPCFYATQKKMATASEDWRCEVDARLQSVALWRTAQRVRMNRYVPAGTQVQWHDRENGHIITQADYDGTFVSV